MERLLSEALGIEGGEKVPREAIASKRMKESY
jgi:hypothetical protein